LQATQCAGMCLKAYAASQLQVKPLKCRTFASTYIVCSRTGLARRFEKDLYSISAPGIPAFD
jgi:hypothetical protein